MCINQEIVLTRVHVVVMVKKWRIVKCARKIEGEKWPNTLKIVTERHFLPFPAERCQPAAHAIAEAHAKLANA